MGTSAALLHSDANKRHEPGKTLLYQIVEHHYPEFADLMEAKGRELPDFVQRTFSDYLAALIPLPRMNLTRYSGVFAPNHRWRAQVTPSGRGSGRATNDTAKAEPTGQRRNMTWAQRLKRVFAIDIETCDSCSGPVRVIACIEEPAIIDKILSHLRQTGKLEPSIRQGNLLPPLRAPPDVV